MQSIKCSTIILIIRIPPGDSNVYSLREFVHSNGTLFYSPGGELYALCKASRHLIHNKGNKSLVLNALRHYERSIERAVIIGSYICTVAVGSKSAILKVKESIALKIVYLDALQALPQRLCRKALAGEYGNLNLTHPVSDGYIYLVLAWKLQGTLSPKNLTASVVLPAALVCLDCKWNGTHICHAAGVGVVAVEISRCGVIFPIVLLLGFPDSTSVREFYIAQMVSGIHQTA